MCLLIPQKHIMKHISFTTIINRRENLSISALLTSHLFIYINKSI